MSSDANNEAAEPSDDSPAPAAPEASADGTHAATNSALPSIIIDPSLDQPTDLPSPGVNGDDTSAPAPAAPGEAAPHDDEEGAWSVGAMSEFDADRFADSLRPSWEVPAVRDQAAWSTGGAPLTPASTHVDAFTSSRSSSDSLPPPVLARGLDRRLLAGIGAGLLVILVTLWSLVGGEPEPPPSWNGQTEASRATSTPPPVAPEPNTPSATPPATPPAVEPVTAPDLAEPAPSVPAAVPPQATQEPTTAAATTTPPAPTRPKSVHVRISTVPASAALTLDGDSIPNPFDAWVAESGARAVVASADGYAERTWSVTFDQDQTLSLVLKRNVTPAPRRPARPRPAPRKPAKPRGAGFVTDNPY